MDAAGLGLATLDLCIKGGKKLYAICQRYQHADRQIRESILCIEAVWLKTQSQMEALRELWDSLDERVQLHQSTVLSLLHEKIQIGVALLQGLDSLADLEPSMQSLYKSTGGDLKRFKYAASTSRKLEKVMKELERWQKIFDPSWYLLARTAAPNLSQNGEGRDIFIIKELRRVQRENVDPRPSQSSIFVQPQLSVHEPKRMTYTCTTFGYAAGQAVIIDSSSVDGKDIQETTKDVRDVARILATVDPNIFGLLKCQGVVRKYDSSQVTGFDIIFTIPEGLTNPRSLRGFLLTADARPTLDSRFRLARLLARSISFLHTAQIVHKNISPDTIVLLENSTNHTETPFLVGFEKFRRAKGRTYLSGDIDWEKNLYRHPKRQGLGVSFVDFDRKASSDQNPKGAVPNPILEIAGHLKNKDMRARAFQIKHRLVAMAENNLPGSMGKVYTNVVISCLTCLDPGNQGFGDESDFTDEDGVLVGIRYIEKILYSLEEIQF